MENRSFLIDGEWEKKNQTNKQISNVSCSTYIICPIKINTVLHLIDSCICTWHFIWFSYINYKDADTLSRMQHTRMRLSVSLHLPHTRTRTQKHTHTHTRTCIQLNRIWTRNAITNNRNCTKEVNLIKCDRGCKATRSTDHGANKSEVGTCERKCCNDAVIVSWNSLTRCTATQWQGNWNHKTKDSKTIFIAIAIAIANHFSNRIILIQYTHIFVCFFFFFFKDFNSISFSFASSVPFRWWWVDVSQS